MQKQHSSLVYRTLGQTPFVFLMARVPLIVIVVVALTLFDGIIDGAMREAMRYAVLDKPQQLLWIGLALVFAAVALRFTCESIIALVAPDLEGRPARLAMVLPRLCAFLAGLAAGVPLIILAYAATNNVSALGEPIKESRTVLEALVLSGNDRVALIAGAAYIFIGLAAALIGQGLRFDSAGRQDAGVANLFVRLALAFSPLFIVFVVLLGALALFGIDPFALADDSGKLLQSKTLTGFADNILGRYAEFGWSLFIAELVGVYFACLGARFALQVLIGFFFPVDERSLSTWGLIAWLVPRIVAVTLGLLVATEVWKQTPPVAGVNVVLSCKAVADKKEASQKLDVAYIDDIRACVRATFELNRTEESVVNRTTASIIAIVKFEDWTRFYQRVVVSVAIGLVALLATGVLTGALLQLRPDAPSSLFERAATGWHEGSKRFSGFRTRWQWLFGIFVAISLVVVVAFFLVWVPQTAQTVGAAAVVLFWAGAAATLLFPLAFFAHMTRMPLLLLMFALITAFSGLNLNDNHVVRGTPEQPTAQPQKRFAHTGQAAGAEIFTPYVDFQDWLNKRPDLDRYKGEYPVFLVATEGGGLRAAYFTAKVMGALQDLCPAFAAHTLAISGVSGGSVGAAAFATAIAESGTGNTAAPCLLDGKNDNFRRRIDGAVSSDLLSPLFAGMFFPDMVQRVLPQSYPWLDRGRALEYAFQGGWPDCKPAAEDCGLARKLSTLHLGPHGVEVPHLILNTTEVETGRMVPVSTLALVDEKKSDLTDPINPFIRFQKRYFSASEDRDADGTLDGKDHGDIAISTAAMLSARFPYVTPAGRVNDRFGRSNRLVDGGYFENSGTWIVARLWEHLFGQIRKAKADRERAGPEGADPRTKNVSRARIYVIILRSTPCTRKTMESECEEDVQTRRTAGWNEVMTPIRTLMNTRSARAEYLRRDLDTVMTAITGEQANIIQIGFENALGTNVPLTWLLSSSARGAVDGAVSDMINTVVEKAPGGVATTADGKEIRYLNSEHVQKRRADNNGSLTGAVERIVCALMTTGQPEETPIAPSANSGVPGCRTRSEPVTQSATAPATQ